MKTDFVSLYLFSSTKKKTTRVDRDTIPSRIARVLKLKTWIKLPVSSLLYLNTRKTRERIMIIMLVFSHSFLSFVNWSPRHIYPAHIFLWLILFFLHRKGLLRSHPLLYTWLLPCSPWQSLPFHTSWLL